MKVSTEWLEVTMFHLKFQLPTVLQGQVTIMKPLHSPLSRKQSPKRESN